MLEYILVKTTPRYTEPFNQWCRLSPLSSSNNVSFLSPQQRPGRRIRLPFCVGFKKMALQAAWLSCAVAGVWTTFRFVDKRLERERARFSRHEAILLLEVVSLLLILAKYYETDPPADLLARLCAPGHRYMERSDA